MIKDKTFLPELDSVPGNIKGCDKSESEMCSISQFEASFKSLFAVKNNARLQASRGNPNCVNVVSILGSKTNGGGSE